MSGELLGGVLDLAGREKGRGAVWNEFKKLYPKTLTGLIEAVGKSSNSYDIFFGWDRAGKASLSRSDPYSGQGWVGAMGEEVGVRMYWQASQVVDLGAVKDEEGLFVSTGGVRVLLGFDKIGVSQIQEGGKSVEYDLNQDLPPVWVGELLDMLCYSSGAEVPFCGASVRRLGTITREIKALADRTKVDASSLVWDLVKQVRADGEYLRKKKDETHGRESYALDGCFPQISQIGYLLLCLAGFEEGVIPDGAGVTFGADESRSVGVFVGLRDSETVERNGVNLFFGYDMKAARVEDGVALRPEEVEINNFEDERNLLLFVRALQELVLASVIV